MTELLSLRDLRVGFGGREVVRGVDLTVRSGRVTALVGESGSGKSLTALSVIGLAPQNARVSGSVLLGGEELIGRDESDLRAIRSRRIGVIFQEPIRSLSPVMRIDRVFRDVLAVREDLRARAAVQQRTLDLLASVGLTDPARIARSYPHEVSGGEMQRVMIALALSGDPDLLIADEPTTALDVTVQRGILELLVRIVRERDLGVLLITHDMGVVGEIADEVVVLDHGTAVETGAARDVLEAPQNPYTQELLSAVPRLSDGVARAASLAPVEASVVASAHDVVVQYGRGAQATPALRGVDLDIRRGEVHGLVGESGSGKSTLGRALAGLVPVASGTVELDGVRPDTLSPRERRALYGRVGIVFQDPASSLNPRRRIGWSIAEPLRLAGGAGRGVDRAETDRRVREALERVQLPASFADRLPHEISGGQRQRVSIARALINEPALLIADEPTSALDVTIQARVLDVLRDAVADSGLACLFISHDLAVVSMLADRVTVLRHGAVVERGAVAQVLGDPQEDYTRRLLASVPDPTRRLA